ncbi:hypothetical protein CC86DRAFT_383123 [Ophiobolus disseminans]|uniref:Uncharacterized protein n=1 Tax=Ophiobolus disseminans TaxID=1469910 RepID=A0A6A6ZWH5_9PLEO|nr:hypothetical protein CC86DRAFT_383123 [Ophiobolus disseminans]
MPQPPTTETTSKCSDLLKNRLQGKPPIDRRIRCRDAVQTGLVKVTFGARCGSLYVGAKCGRGKSRSYYGGNIGSPRALDKLYHAAITQRVQSRRPFAINNPLLRCNVPDPPTLVQTTSASIRIQHENSKEKQLADLAFKHRRPGFLINHLVSAGHTSFQGRHSASTRAS